MPGQSDLLLCVRAGGGGGGGDLPGSRRWRESQEEMVSGQGLQCGLACNTSIPLSLPWFPLAS